MVFAPYRAIQVDDNSDVDGDSDRFQPGGVAGELIAFKWQQQCSRHHGEPFRPTLAVEEAAAFDEFEHAVADCRRTEQSHLVSSQVAEFRDQVADERPLRIELEPAREMVGDLAEVRARLREQVNTRSKQQQPTQRALESDQPDDTTNGAISRDQSILSAAGAGPAGLAVGGCGQLSPRR